MVLLYSFTDLFNVRNNATASLVKDSRTPVLLLHLPCWNMLFGKWGEFGLAQTDTRLEKEGAC